MDKSNISLYKKTKRTEKSAEEKKNRNEASKTSPNSLTHPRVPLSPIGYSLPLILIVSYLIQSADTCWV